MTNRNYHLLIFVLLALLLFSGKKVIAQTDPVYPIYYVQSGDTLSEIAYIFGTTITEILLVNQIPDPNNLAIGTPIKLPSFEGYSGVFALRPINLGETLQSLSNKYGISTELITKINRITSPFEFYVGRNLIIPENDDSNHLKPIGQLKANQSVLELSIRNNINPWIFILDNSKNSSTDFQASEIVYGQGSGSEEDVSSFPISEIILSPLPIYQGDTVQINVITNQSITLTGSFGNRDLIFFPIDEKQQVTLLGIGAKEDTGITLFSLSGITSDEERVFFEQNILIYPRNYGVDPPLYVDPITIDPTVIASEDAMMAEIVNQVTPVRHWNQLFQYPMDDPCVGAYYGGNRIYNGTYSYYHTGVDFIVCTQNTNVYASAPGIVAYSGETIIRGNAILIDHGWGVYSAYYHLSEKLVQQGDQVETGTLLGYVGNTGRSTGYHLHWEIWVNGIQVEPFTWLSTIYPKPLDN